MAKKTSKIIHLIPEKILARAVTRDHAEIESVNYQPTQKAKKRTRSFDIAGNESFGRPKQVWRLQFSAIFWHVVLLLLPPYAVWQGLFVDGGAWLSLGLWSLFSSFFLVFLSEDRMAICTQAPYAWQQWFRRSKNYCSKTQGHRGPNVKVARAESASIFGNYANDGKGNWGTANSVADDDGISIEEYLEKSKGQEKGTIKNLGFDWNWKQNSLDKDSVAETVELLKKQQKISGLNWEFRIRSKAKVLQDSWQKNWWETWEHAFPVRGQRQLLQLLFWLALLYLPLSFALLKLGIPAGQEISILQRSGFFAGGSSNWASFYSFLVLLLVSVPLLSQFVCQKLQRSLNLAESRKTAKARRLCQIFQLVVEFGYSLALLLLLGIFERSGGKTGLGFVVALICVLSLFCMMYRLILLQRLKKALPLWLFRLLSCFSLSAGLLLYL